MEQEKKMKQKRKQKVATIVLFIFGLLMLMEAFRQTNPVSISTAFIIGGLLVIFMGRGLLKKE